MILCALTTLLSLAMFEVQVSPITLAQCLFYKNTYIYTLLYLQSSMLLSGQMKKNYVLMYVIKILKFNDAIILQLNILVC